MKKRLLACLLTAAMLVSLFPLPALAAEEYSGGLCPHHTEHTGDCGYVEAVEGQPCGHVHDGACGYVEAAEEVPCDMDCAETDGDGQIVHAEGCAYTPAVEGAPCQHEHDDECGYVPATEGAPCTFVCEECKQADENTSEDPETACICTALCTTEAVNEDCPVCGAEDADLALCKGEKEPTTPSNAQTTLTQLITAWEWVDEWEALSYDEGAAAWVLALPGANESNPAMREEVVSLLPAQITAMLGEGQEMISLDGWTCEGYPDAGAGSGSYTFTAGLPEGYGLDGDAPALVVTVELGGAMLLAGETGNFTVTGGTWDMDYSYADNTLTIKTNANLTISGTTTDRIVIADGITANVTIDGLNIDTTAGSAIDIGAGSTLNLTLSGSNKLCPGGRKPVSMCPRAQAWLSPGMVR